MNGQDSGSFPPVAIGSLNPFKFIRDAEAISRARGVQAIPELRAALSDYLTGYVDDSGLIHLVREALGQPYHGAVSSGAR